MAPGCVLQRDAHEIYDRIDSVRKAATDLRVSTEDDAMIRRIDELRSQNIANPTRQYEVVVPLALPQQRVRKTLREFLPASIEQRRVGIQSCVCRT
jgi:hypothetical protein